MWRTASGSDGNNSSACCGFRAPHANVEAQVAPKASEDGANIVAARMSGGARKRKGRRSKATGNDAGGGAGGHDTKFGYGVGAVKRWLDRLGTINPKQIPEIIAYFDEMCQDENDNFCEALIALSEDPGYKERWGRCRDLWLDYLDGAVA